MGSEIEFDPATLLSHRIEIERELFRRSYYEFYVGAWHVMDPTPFADGKHIRLICRDLQHLARRDWREQVFCIPPRHSKTLLCSVAFPAWVWTWWPAARFITSSYDQTLASRDSNWCRRLVEHPWYQARWPEVRMQKDQNAKTFYETVQGGARFISSPTAKLTGHGADFSIFDDPHNVRKGESEADRDNAIKFWFEAMPSRLNNPLKGVKIVVQQRVNEKDVAGECIRRGYKNLVLPARFEPDHPDRSPDDWRTEPGEELWPELFPSAALADLEEAMGPYAAAGQLQQRPAPRTGGFFDRASFEILQQLPLGSMDVWRIWDLAATEKSLKSSDPDWTVGLKIVRVTHPAGMVRYVITDMVRLRGNPAEVERAMKNTATQDGPTTKIFVPQDAGQAGKAQIAHIIGTVLQGYTVFSAPVTGDKVLRATPASALAQAGFIALLDRGWDIRAFLDEVSGFPTGAHDDIVDTLSDGIARFSAGDTGMLEWMRQQALATGAAASATQSGLSDLNAEPTAARTLPTIVTE